MKRSPLRGFLLISFVLVCFGLSPQARATCQEGCLTNANTVLGDDALLNNIGGHDNTAIGSFALFNNTTGYDNAAIGVMALTANTTGADNVAIGDGALQETTTGNFNTAIGIEALVQNTGNTNIAVGALAGLNLTTGNNNIDIGNTGVQGESHTIRIGTNRAQTRTFVAGISGVTVSGGVGVIVGPTGQLGTVVSSERFKAEIKPMDKASEAILALNPVTFRYKHDLDPDGIPQFGLVAEQVEKVNPDLVARDEQGKPYTVRYEAVNAMLLNEFLKEHKKVQELETTVAQQHKDFEAAVAELKGQLQKVSAQVELSEAAAQTVTANH